MADERLPALTAITTIASADLFYVVDVSDTTEDASGSSRRVTAENLFGAISTPISTSSTVTLTGTYANGAIDLPNNAWIRGRNLANSAWLNIFRADSTGLNWIEWGTPFYIDSAAGGIKSVAVPATGGTGYVVGDVLTITGGSGSGATAKVTAVSSGAVTGLMIANQGINYGNSNFTAGFSGGTGSGIGTATATVWAGYNNRANGGTHIGIVHDKPNASTHGPTLSVKSWASSSSSSNPYGTFAGYFEVNDRPDVTSSPDNRPTMYGVRISCNPLVTRSNVPYDDVVGLIIKNESTGVRATDCIYIGQSDGDPISGNVDWAYAVLAEVCTNNSQFCSKGKSGIGLDLYGATGVTYTTCAIRVPNNSPYYARNAADSANVSLFTCNTINEMQINAPVRFQSNLAIADGINLIFSTSTGTKIGTATTQKIGFYNATPVVQPANTTPLYSTLTTLGLLATGGTAGPTIQATVVDYTTDVTTGDGKHYMHVPPALNGLNLVYVHARVITAGTTNTSDIQIARTRSGSTVDMLSTKITIDSTETGSDTAATAAVINGSNDDVATNDILRIDVDAVSTTKPKGLIVTLGFGL